MTLQPTATPATPRAPIAERVTAQIIELLNHGVRPWTPRWSTDQALALPVRHNGVAYRGINILILWAAAQTHGFTARRWFSFRQARALSASVRRGERATHIVFYSGADTTGTGDDGGNRIAAAADEERPRRAILRSYAVFNADQIEGLPPEFLDLPPAQPAQEDNAAWVAQLDPLFQRVPATVVHGGSRACYAPDADTIFLPPRAAFDSTALYYATLTHELGHWTGHRSRLDRDLHTRATPMAYAKEELVAELAAAFLGAELSLPPDHIEDHAAYLDHWLKLLDREPGALLAAAGRAQAAVDFLRPYLGRAPTTPTAPA